MDMKAALAEVTDELAEAEAKLRSMEEHVSELRTMRAGLELAVGKFDQSGGGEERAFADRQESTPASTAGDGKPPRLNLPGIPPPSSRRKGKQPSQTDLSFAALKDIGGRGSTVEIRERVAAAGYDKLKTEQIRNALTWLRSKERVLRSAPGIWEIPQESSVKDDFTPAVSAAGVSTTGENGHSSQSHVLTRADLAPQPAGQVAS